MKRIFTFFISLGMVVVSMAQSNNISLYVYAPEQAEKVPDTSVNYLINSLCNAVTTDGLAAQNDFMTQFTLMPKIGVATKNILANVQQQVVLTLDVWLQVADRLTGTVYASCTLNMKGVGTNETKAYISAFRTLSKSNRQIQSLVSTAKQKILAYYESESDNIIKRAKQLAAQEMYDEAFYLLSMIPSQCSKFDDGIAASLDIWQNYKDKACHENLAKAKSIWVAGQDLEAANNAGAYLSQILPDSGCYDEAQRLCDDIKAKTGELWKFEMSMYKDENELRMAKIKAMQEIGVAYGQGQQPNMIITTPKRQNK